MSGISREYFDKTILDEEPTGHQEISTDVLCIIVFSGESVGVRTRKRSRINDRHVRTVVHSNESPNQLTNTEILPKMYT